MKQAMFPKFVASLYYCSFEIGPSNILKAQSEKTCYTNLSGRLTFKPFCELYSAFNILSLCKVFVIFLPSQSDYIFTYSEQRPK